MLVKEYFDSTELQNLSGDVLGIDLELANSFRSEPSVICMVGLQRYDPRAKTACTTIATITRRPEEEALMRWLLDQMQEFKDQYPDGKLLTFSGLDNDVPWLNDRLRRLEIESPENAVLNKLGHVDLKVEFFHRTQNNKISLKKLEEIFGIERGSTVTSKKVSYILTDLVRRDKKDSPIPDRLYDYLRDDVYNLFAIHNSWMDIPLMRHNLTDSEVHELLVSIIRTVDKFITSQENRNGYKKEFSVLKGYRTELRRSMSRVEEAQTFAEFKLPGFPLLKLRHPEFERIRKKHKYLDSLGMVDAESGAYRLKTQIFKPKGALAVVRHEGRLLMIRRSHTVKRAAGFWGLPGGVVEQGETPEEGAVRELMEEVNLSGEVLNVLGTSSSFSGEFELTWVEIEVSDISTLRPNTSEVSIIRWVEPGEVSRLDPLIPGALEGFQKFLGPDWD